MLWWWHGYDLDQSHLESKSSPLVFKRTLCALEMPFLEFPHYILRWRVKLVNQLMQMFFATALQTLWGRWWWWYVKFRCNKLNTCLSLWLRTSLDALTFPDLYTKTDVNNTVLWVLFNVQRPHIRKYLFFIKYDINVCNWYTKWHGSDPSVRCPHAFVMPSRSFSPPLWLTVWLCANLQR